MNNFFAPQAPDAAQFYSHQQATLAGVAAVAASGHPGHSVPGQASSMVRLQQLTQGLDLLSQQVPVGPSPHQVGGLIFYTNQWP